MEQGKTSQARSTDINMTKDAAAMGQGTQGKAAASAPGGEPALQLINSHIHYLTAFFPRTYKFKPLCLVHTQIRCLHWTLRCVACLLCPLQDQAR